MKWILLLTVLSGYPGTSTVAVNFDSKDACMSAAKSHEQAIHELHQETFHVVWTCSPATKS